MLIHKKISHNMEHIIDPVYYQDFILSGKPEFTLKSLKTEHEEIFVVKRGKPSSTRTNTAYWVNNRLREYLGMLYISPDAIENIWVFDQKLGDISVFQADQIKIFSWFWRQLLLGNEANDDFKKRIQIINHTGRCGHCHRELTHPESIPIGIGPDCFKKLGLTHKTLVNSSP
jgi:hypothetical protein